MKEKEVSDILDTLPDESPIRNYCRWAALCTDAPMAYHLVCALSLLGAIQPTEAGLYAGQRYLAPQWVLIVGESGESRKSAAIGCAKDVLREVAFDRLSGEPGSAQGLYRDLSEHEGKRLIAYTEFGAFLADSRKKGVCGPIREAYTSMWDGQQTAFKLAKAKDDRVIAAPRLSLLAGSTPAYLEAHTDFTDWEGGFLSRWMIVHASRERSMPFPLGDDVLKARVMEQFGALATSASMPAVGMTGKASRRYIGWFKDLDSIGQQSNIAGLANRAPTVALKCALGHAYAHRMGPTQMEGWKLELADVEFGITLAEAHCRASKAVLAAIGGTPYERHCRQVVRALQIEELSFAQLMRLVSPAVPVKRLREILEGLVESEQIESCIQGSSETYRLVST